MAPKTSSFRKILSGERRGIAERAIVTLMLPLSFLYGFVMRVRRACYRQGIFTTRRLSKPVISVGNITAGGTGKTPVAACIARFFIERGLRVAVLSRGYGGKGDGSPRVVADGHQILLSAAEAGDEPVLLARMIPGLMVVTGHSRYEAGQLAEAKLQPDIFLLDDGFQHRKLHRDLDIVLLDHRRPFGNGHVIPAGLLREPKQALKNCDLIIFTRALGHRSPSLQMNIPMLTSSHDIVGFRGLCTGKSATPDAAVPQGRGVACAGIADPSAFFEMLAAKGVALKGSMSFPDHVPYDEGVVAAIAAAVHEAGADFVVTTEKDAVKLEGYLEQVPVPIYAAVLDVSFAEKDAFENHFAPYLTHTDKA